MKSDWLLRIAVILAGAACMAPGCNGDVLSDSAFKLWCGPNEDQLCPPWQVDQGNVQKAPTWNDHEFGVELVDIGTQISQLSSEGSDCMEFSAVADVDAAADVKVGIDFDLDGNVDSPTSIDETHWHVARTLIHAPYGYGQKLRFVVRKEGAGHALLAELRLQRVDTCTGPRIELKNRAIGQVCTEDKECSSGVCCGRRDVPDGDGGVATFLGSCSQCCDGAGHACASGGTCKARSDIPGNVYVAPPLLCDPQQGKGASGAPCFDGTDCMSGGCDGAVTCPSAGTTPCSIHAGGCK